MAVPEAALIGRARRAYEWGRVRAALPAVAVVVPMVALSLVFCGRGLASVGCGAALAAVLLAAGWRGQDYRRGVRVGLVAGLGPFVMPIAQGGVMFCTSGVCWASPAICVVGGTLGGLMIAAFVLRRRDGAAVSTSFLVTALVTAGLAGSLGCLMLGLIGVLAMGAGLAMGATPALVWSARHGG